ncbi:MAG: hypothetical protein E6J43_05610, partial [Chloroflexi bacterium]
PFFVNEIVRLLVADGRLEHAESVSSWSVTIPQSVKEVVGRRLDHLSEECNRVLTIGSVIGREFGLRLLEKVSELKGDRLLEALEEAMGARVIAELARTTDQYWFSHALIRETLYEELSTTRRVRLHRQIGEALEEMDAEGNLPRLAYHFCEAAPAGDVDKAVGYAKRAGAKAMSMIAYEDAAAHYGRGLQALEVKETADDAARYDLLMALGDARIQSGDGEGSKQTYSRAAEIARRLGDRERFAQAALGFAELLPIGRVEEDKLEMLDEALARIGPEDSAFRALLLAQRGIAVYFRSQDELRANCREAVEIARRVGDRTALTRSLYASVFGAIDLVDVDERLAIAEEIVRLGEEAQDNELVLRGFFIRAGMRVILGDMEAANGDIDRYAALAAELRVPRWIWQAELLRAMQALFAGSIADAEPLAFKAFETGRLADPDNFLQMYSVQLFAIRREQGRVEEMLPATQAFVAQLPLVPAWRAGLAYQYAEAGRKEEAGREFEVLAADAFSALPKDGNWPIAMALLAEVCCALEDTERAAILYEKISPLSELCVVVGLAIDCYGPLAQAAGRLATTLQRWDDAQRHFETSLAINKRMGSGRWTGWTQFRYSDMLLRRDAPSLALKLKAQGADLSDIGTSIDTVAREVLEHKPDLKSHAAPDGTVTIMFSDIEGSTSMADRLGDARFMELLREHNAIVREQIKAHRGFEVKSEGDGFMVAFQSAGKALACASAIQKMLVGRNESAAEPVKVRIGLHAGEVIKEGEDFFGRNVIMAARVASQARGEILASGVVKALVAGSDITWGELRTVELKGLSGDHEIWPVNWNSRKLGPA